MLDDSNCFEKLNLKDNVKRKQSKNAFNITANQMSDISNQNESNSNLINNFVGDDSKDLLVATFRNEKQKLKKDSNKRFSIAEDDIIKIHRVESPPILTIPRKKIQFEKKTSTEIIAGPNTSQFLKELLNKNPSLLPNKSLNFSRYSNISSQKSIQSKMLWNAKTVKSVWDRLQFIKKKVESKKKGDYLMIKNAIAEDRDKLVIKTLKDENFKKFYRNKDEIFPENVFFDVMIQHLKFNLIIEIMKDSSYKFDYEFIFEFLIKFLTKKQMKDNPNETFSVMSHNDSIFDNDIVLKRSQKEYYENSPIQALFKAKSIFENLVKYKLYPKEEKKIKILAWFFAFFDFPDIFLLLIFQKENKLFFQNEIQCYDNFRAPLSIHTYAKSTTLFKEIITYCLQCKLEYLACIFCQLNSTKDISGLPIIAAETGNMDFLKFLWESEDRKIPEGKKQNDGVVRFSFGNPSFINHKLVDLNKILNSNIGDFYPKFSINSVIKTICKHSCENKTKPKEINVNLSKIIYWKNIEKDPTFIDSLFQYNCFEQIGTLIYLWPEEFFMKEEYFKAVIQKKETELILYFLRNRSLNNVLNDYSLQEFIVNEYTVYGDKLYYAAEMFIYIYKDQWSRELTRPLCKNIMKNIKTKDILNCHSPILTCLLLCEFLEKIRELSIVTMKNCEKVISALKEYCKNIQEANPTESYISYLMKQKDTLNRSAFQITSEYQYYSLLETPEIGTVVRKMWEGKISYNNLYAASALHRYLFDHDKKVTDPFYAFDMLDRSKVYFFQLDVWVDSCLLRFFPVGIDTVAMVAIYNIYIYILNLEGRLMNNYAELSPRLSHLLNAYLILITSLIIDYLTKIIFIAKARREFKLEVWSVIDFLLFIFAWLTLLDTKKIANYYCTYSLDQNVRNYLWSLHLPFIKEFGTEYETYSSSIAFLIRVIILSINDLLVWIRVCGILLVFKEMGPVIRMIISMALYLVKYIVVIVIFLAWCATVFTVIFNRYSLQFVSISTSVLTLFGSFLNNFDVTDFDDTMKTFGSVLFMGYSCIAGVLLVNLLIAVLSNIYEEMSKVVDASHRSTLIQYSQKSKWDNQCGYLMFLTSPLTNINIITLLIEHFFCWGKDKKKFNIFVTRLYYLLFYFPIIVGLFMIYSAVLIPFCMIKGLIMMIQYENSLKILRIFKVINSFRWMIQGIFYLLYIYVRDIACLFIYVFKKATKKSSEFQRIRRNLKNEDIIIFLKFIHSKKKDNQKKDIHSLFMAYLDFEAGEKAQVNKAFKTRKEYLSKLDREIGKTSKSLDNKKIFLYNDIENGINASKLYTSFIRKNLMIIEILENFIIYEEVGDNLVDIEKMKKLLPMTMNISNFHLRRLVHSNVHALSQAITKFKLNKKNFTEYQLINKIVQLAQRIDKEIDSEILRIQRRKITSSKIEALIGAKEPIENISDNDEPGRNDMKIMTTYVNKIEDMQIMYSDMTAKKREKRGSITEINEKSSKSSKKEGNITSRSMTTKTMINTNSSCNEKLPSLTNSSTNKN